MRQEVRDAAGRRHRGRWRVIGEFTRAPIDAAFGSLLTALGGQRTPLMVPTDDGSEAPLPLPRDFRIIGTLNSFDRHFLNQISEAMKRRFTFIDILPPGRELAFPQLAELLPQARRMVEGANGGVAALEARVAAHIAPGGNRAKVFVDRKHRNATTRSHAEASLVADLIVTLLEAGIAPDEIGVVAPYRAQGREIRNLLRTVVPEAAVRRQIVTDTVERLQGQERDLVILSLTTSNPVFAANLAEFFFQPERLNVAITRPRSKLIIVGSSHLFTTAPENLEYQGLVEQLQDLITTCASCPTRGRIASAYTYRRVIFLCDLERCGELLCLFDCLSQSDLIPITSALEKAFKK